MIISQKTLDWSSQKKFALIGYVFLNFNYKFSCDLFFTALFLLPATASVMKQNIGDLVPSLAVQEALAVAQGRENVTNTYRLLITCNIYESRSSKLTGLRSPVPFY